MDDQDTFFASPAKREPWNKGKFTGARPPLRPKHVWSTRSKLQAEGRLYRFQEVHGAFPPKLRRATLYVLKEDDTPWQATMICPCGCRATLEMNLLPDERPIWRYTINAEGCPSLHPSIWRQVGCRSHFSLREGRIIWANDL